MTSSALPEGWQPAPSGYKHVVSVSIGSGKRDAREELEVLGQHFILERIGTDGDMGKAAALIVELDGKVDAFGLGGADLSVLAAGRAYTFREIRRMVAGAVKTPIVDGGGLKNTLERDAIYQLEGEIKWKSSKALMVSAVDRFGMAEALWGVGAEVVYGDLLFGLGLPIPIRTLAGLQNLARGILPVVTQLPFKWFYPTGKKQEESVLKNAGTKYFEWADVIAGDTHYIKRYAPARLEGKTILTQTLTPEDLDWMRSRGVEKLITTTPQTGNRIFATNVLEAFFVALAGKERALEPEEYRSFIAQMGYKPNVVKL